MSGNSSQTTNDHSSLPTRSSMRLAIKESLEVAAEVEKQFLFPNCIGVQPIPVFSVLVPLEHINTSVPVRDPSSLPSAPTLSNVRRSTGAAPVPPPDRQSADRLPIGSQSPSMEARHGESSSVSKNDDTEIRRPAGSAPAPFENGPSASGPVSRLPTSSLDRPTDPRLGSAIYLSRSTHAKTWVPSTARSSTSSNSAIVPSASLTRGPRSSDSTPAFHRIRSSGSSSSVHHHRQHSTTRTPPATSETEASSTVWNAHNRSLLSIARRGGIVDGPNSWTPYQSSNTRDVSPTRNMSPPTKIRRLSGQSSSGGSASHQPNSDNDVECLGEVAAPPTKIAPMSKPTGARFHDWLEWTHEGLLEWARNCQAGAHIMEVIKKHRIDGRMLDYMIRANNRTKEGRIYDFTITEVRWIWLQLQPNCLTFFEDDIQIV